MATQKYDPQTHHRRSIRLKGYDYSQAGAYFVTICTQHKACLFGHVENEAMVLNDAGRMVNEQWLALVDRFPGIGLGDFVTMPNHFHGILVIREGEEQVSMNRATIKVAPTLGQIVGAFKSVTTHAYIGGVENLGWPCFDGRLWQRNYFEHIIRNEKSYRDVVEYIRTNPARWQDDTYYVR